MMTRRPHLRASRPDLRNPTRFRPGPLARWSIAIAIAIALTASIGCGDAAPPRVVASIDGMVAYGDCDGGADNPGDFFFSIELNEVTYPEPAPGRADPTGADGVSPAESPAPVYVLLDQIERVLVQAESSPDPVRLPKLEVSAPFDEAESIALSVTLSVYENDGAGPQWTAEEERPMLWHPGEQCWMRYGDLGCVAREPGDPIWTGDLDYGSEGSSCDVEIDWSITYE